TATTHRDPPLSPAPQPRGRHLPGARWWRLACARRHTWLAVRRSRRRTGRGALARSQFRPPNHGAFSMSAAAHVAAVLAGTKVRAHGGNYLVRCPAHDDDSRSLSLRDGTRGLIIHGFAGCSAGDIYAAIRRKDHNLLEPGQTAPEPAKGSSEYERRQHDKARWLWSRRRPIAGTIAETYLREARRYI